MTEETKKHLTSMLGESIEDLIRKKDGDSEKEAARLILMYADLISSEPRIPVAATPNKEYGEPYDLRIGWEKVDLIDWSRFKRAIVEQADADKGAKIEIPILPRLTKPATTYPTLPYTPKDVSDSFDEWRKKEREVLHMATSLVVAINAARGTHNLSGLAFLRIADQLGSALTRYNSPYGDVAGIIHLMKKHWAQDIQQREEARQVEVASLRREIYEAEQVLRSVETANPFSEDAKHIRKYFEWSASWKKLQYKP